MQITWLGRIGRHTVTIGGPREVDAAEARRIFAGWKRARAKDGTRIEVDGLTIRAWRSIAGPRP
jgi:hypothetical protein